MLAAESRHADLLVVGGRGRGRFSSLLAGSVAVGVSTHAACPVAVVRGEEHGDTGPVVLGVEAARSGETAVTFAFQAAAAWKVPLITVRTLGFPPGDARTAPMWSESSRDAERKLGESLAGWTEKYPDVPVQRIVSHRAACPVAVVRPTRR